jgi:hypothetical protein
MYSNIVFERKVEAQHDAFAAGNAKRHMEEFLAKRRNKS